MSIRKLQKAERAINALEEKIEEAAIEALKAAFVLKHEDATVYDRAVKINTAMTQVTIMISDLSDSISDHIDREQAAIDAKKPTPEKSNGQSNKKSM